MQYRPLAQAEHDAPPEQYTVPVIASSPLHLALTSLEPAIPGPSINDPRSFDHPDNEVTSVSRVGSILRSLASSHSYEVVQEKDYKEEHVKPLKIRKRGTQIESTDLTESPTVLQSQFEEAPVRTASISRNLPLNHPKPDLQSMQGAYVKNVERLEETAERLSITSSLEDEVQKMRLDRRPLYRQSSAPTGVSLPQTTVPSRKVSSASLANSITNVNATARCGGYSPSGYVTSFQEAARSGSWSRSHNHRPNSKGSRLETRIQEQSFESRSFTPSPNSPPIEGAFPHTHSQHSRDLESGVANTQSPTHRLSSSASADRPPTSASNDTYRQATSLFRDFDGVHYMTNSSAPDGRKTSVNRQIPLNHPPLATDSKAYREAQPGQNMVYYPAPVPMMLNLPPKLSNFSVTDRDKRRLQALSGMPAELRKSAAWLQGDLSGPESLRQSRQSLAGLPPQLRASAFFDQPSASQNLRLQGGSAVATLDSILDASAHAPVSAFTDHPIVGQLGREVYGKETSRKSVQMQDLKPKKAARRVSSLSNMLGAGRRVSGALSMDDAGRHVSRESKASEIEADLHGTNYDDDVDRAAERSIAPSDDELADDEDEILEAEVESEAAFSGAPTTLLAELQMRKAQQKQRNRTAADAFPNGMHSTLLELDAVTQLQQKARKQKHVALAWEDHDAADQENFDDDDVPLGVLFPGQKEQANANRPVGLLEKRHIDDNEPLSQRRTRLRGDAPSLATRSIISVNQNRASSRYTLAVPGSAEDAAAEPEGETLAQRLKRLRAEREKGEAAKLAGDLSSQLGLKIGDENTRPTSRTPDAEETLGQRRKRLQAEAASGRQVSGGSTEPNNAPLNGPQFNPEHTASMLAQPTMPAFAGSQPHVPTMTAGFMYNNPPVYSPNMAVQMQMAGYGYPFAMQQQMQAMPLGMGPPLDPKQRDGIERWRQSVA